MLRRDFTYRLLASALFAPGLRAQGSSSVRLRDIAAQRGLLAGPAVSYAQLERPEFDGALADEASIVVAENDMKWRRIHPDQDRYDFSRADALLAFATAHGQKLRGHNLCWHEYNPEWLGRNATKRNAADLLRGHIAAVAGHFRGQIHSWDVVNEAVAVEDGREDGLRKSIWLELIGPDYLEVAFRAAAAADPNALLTYNDYDLEQDSPGHERKRQAVLQLLSSLRDRQAPIHALGIQSHLRAELTPAGWSGLHRFLDEVERLDLQVFVTELDVDDRALPADITERDGRVAELYRDYLTNALQHRSVKAVLTWGLTDRDSWLNSSKKRSDGLPQRPLPFDADLKPKPAFFAMRDAIAAVPARQAAGANYDESKAGAYSLPDPLVFKGGKRVRTASEWRNRRRGEILELFEANIYGRSPKPTKKLMYEVFDSGVQALGGKAIRKQVRIYFSSDKSGPKEDLLIYVPAGSKGPVPAILALNFGGNQTVIDDPGVRLATVWNPKSHERHTAPEESRGRSKDFAVEKILGHGHAFATVCYQDLEPDFKGGYVHGIRPLFLKPGQNAPLPEEWGAIGVWGEPGAGLFRMGWRSGCEARGAYGALAFGQDGAVGGRDGRAVSDGVFELFGARRGGAGGAQLWRGDSQSGRSVSVLVLRKLFAVCGPSGTAAGGCA